MFHHMGGVPPRVSSPSIIVTTQHSHMDIYAILADDLKIQPSNVIQLSNERYKIIFSQKDLELITEVDNAKKLEEHGIRPHISSDLCSHRTLLFRNIDVVEMNSGIDGLKSIIENKNNVRVDRIVTIPTNSSFFKIIFNNVEDNDKIKTNGLNLRYTKISTFNIMQERPTQRPIMCKNCYAINEHLTYQCKNNAVCSICASKDHKYTECNNKNNLKCINCGQAHCALVLSCPKIKDAIKKQNANVYQINQNEPNIITSSGNVREDVSYARVMGNNTRVNRPQVSNSQVVTPNLPNENFEYNRAKLQLDMAFKSADLVIKNPKENLRAYQYYVNDSIKVYNNKHNANLPLMEMSEEMLNEFSPKESLAPVVLPMDAPSTSDVTAKIASAPISNNNVNDDPTMDFTLGNNKRDRDNSSSPNKSKKRVAAQGVDSAPAAAAPLVKSKSPSGIPVIIKQTPSRIPIQLKIRNKKHFNFNNITPSSIIDLINNHNAYEGNEWKATDIVNDIKNKKLLVHNFEFDVVNNSRRHSDRRTFSQEAYAKRDGSESGESDKGPSNKKSHNSSLSSNS